MTSRGSREPLAAPPGPNTITQNPVRGSPSPNQQPQALDCCQNYSSPCARSAPTSPSQQAPEWNRRPAGYLPTSPGSRGSVLAPLPTSPLPTSAPQALDCCEASQLSLRAEHAYKHPSEQAPLRTSAPQALDCCEASQLSLRAEHADKHPSEQALPTSHFPSSPIPALTPLPHGDVVRISSGFRRPDMQISGGIRWHNYTVLLKREKRSRSRSML